MSPRRLFRSIAFAEAVTWALLLVGMVLKYVTTTTELGVRVFGMVHGVVFIGYVLATLLCAVDARWPVRRTAWALVAAVPPFCTVWFDLWLESRHPLAGSWRLRAEAPASLPERIAAWLLHHPRRGAAAGAGAVAALTAAALVVGPPVG